jgi:glucose-1-phosphate adenylyltransferase
MVTEGCKVYGKIDFSILFASVTIEEGAVVRDSIVMPGAVIKRGAIVDYSIIGEDAVIGENAKVGSRPEGISDKSDWGISVVGPNVQLSDGTVVKAKEMVENNR